MKKWVKWILSIDYFRVIKSLLNRLMGNMEIYEIAPGLFQASAYKVDDFGKMKMLGIQVVIDLEGGFDHHYQGLESYLYWPIKDIPELPNIKQLNIISFYGYSYWKLGKKVMVHCTQGMNRSGLINGVILCLNGMSGKGAVKLIREKRPGALNNMTFVEYLEKQKDNFIPPFSGWG